MKPYESYKKTDQLWLQDVPSHWKMIKTKYLFDERTEKGYPDEPLLVASQNMGVVPKGVYGNRTVEATKDLHLLKLVKIGDFVISLRSFQGGIEYAYYQGIISPAYTIMVPKNDISTGFFRHLAKSKAFIELLKLCVTGIREGQNIDYVKLKNFRLPVPPRAEQDQIVCFLDWKLSQITKLMKAKKKQIVLLNEQKQAIINKAITKGLDDTVPMKDSGIGWIGEIPKDWGVTRIKNIVTLYNEKTTSNNEFYIGMENIESWTGKYIETEKIIPVGTSNKYKPNCLLFGKLRPYLAKVHLTNNSGICSSEFLVFDDVLCDISYLKYVLLSAKLIDLINSSTFGAKMPRANWNFISNCFLAIPDKGSQKAIVGFLDDYIIKIDVAICKFKTELDLLTEYKASLISSVITGKVDVRDVVVPDFEAEDEVLEDESETFCDEIGASEVNE
ncbi:restriction endonuclease subunit S [Clostridium sp.]|uniref:restriction endonuclease subunit S n=1 Tax=Clostridium sp. TaxID=1506 RepID=UPI0032174410